MTKLVIAVLIVFTLLGGGIGYNIAKNNVEVSQEPELQELGYMGPGVGISSSMLEPIDSTSTDAWVTSISMEFPTGDISDARLNVVLIASTTGTVLNWYHYFSEDGTTWYGEDSEAVSGDTTTHSTSSQKHTITSGTTSEINMTYDLPDMISKYMKITFDVDTASGTLSTTLIK